MPAESATTRAKLLEVRVGDRTETALVDIAVSTERHVGARAVWDPATVTQLFCAFAEPDAIGLSSVLGQLSPVARTNCTGLPPTGRRRTPAGARPDRAGPGRSGRGARDRADAPRPVHPVDARAGVIAVDGERELTFGPAIGLLSGCGPTGPGAWTFPRSWRRALASACSDAPPYHQDRPSKEEYMTDTVERKALTREHLLDVYRTMRTIRVAFLDFSNLI